ncbi:hypothetical protein EF888_07135 [Silicimonas algicola]|uniref:hypothetical protein n=1 Tax=Silicimonas algicola TaxID=1826607 RepID=UPI000D6BC7B7|nr:hypothetical protein [Silicimonas algicola]AZQ66932.1 hypothetical protein EF888_07135 [Silicimonas algicola]
MTQEQLWISSVMPADFLLKQGQYVQTAAHLEKMLWLIWIDAEDYDVSDPDQANVVLQNRKVTQDLRDGLRASIASGKVPFAEQVTEILDEIDDTISGRHMAVHGAWKARPDGLFECEYFRNFGTRKHPDWKSYSLPISMEDVDEALHAVDRLLGQAIKTWSAIRNLRRPEDANA